MLPPSSPLPVNFKITKDFPPKFNITEATCKDTFTECNDCILIDAPIWHFPSATDQNIIDGELDDTICYYLYSKFAKYSIFLGIVHVKVGFATIILDLRKIPVFSFCGSVGEVRVGTPLTLPHHLYLG